MRTPGVGKGREGAFFMSHRDKMSHISRAISTLRVFPRFPERRRSVSTCKTGKIMVYFPVVFWKTATIHYILEERK